MVSTARRWSLRRGRAARRLLVGIAVAAVSIGCVADTWSAAAIAPGAVTGVAVTGVAVTGVATPATPAVPAVTAAPGASIAPSGPSAPLGGWLHRRPPPGPSGPPANSHVAVPILYYHRVQAPPSDFPNWSAAQQKQFLTYNVIPAAFAAQLDWLLAHGYTTILPRDLTAFWDHGAPLPARPVIITFDDGSHDWMTTVLPMLQARGMVAEFYLTLDAIKYGNVTWPQVRRLIKAGNGVGAHDVHHVQLAALHNGHPDASRATMAAEVGEARKAIGRHTGVYPDSMAYVGGGFDAALLQAVRDTGYSSARSIQRGIATDPPERYKLPVVRIGVHDDVIDALHGVIIPGLPTFEKRMRGVSDKAPRSD